MEALPTPNFSIDLSGRVAMVTGTTSGLGDRFARVLAACGASVAITGRRVERLESLAKAINEAGGKCLPVPMDMTDRESIRAGVVAAEAALGTIDILVNNAGIPDAQRVVKMPDQLIDDVFDTNLTGPWILSTEIARRLIAQKMPGNIVNVSSIAAFVISPDAASALYSTTKAALVRMTEALAMEWARFRINVNCIAPGAFATEMLEGMMERTGDFSGIFPRQRICQPEQMDSTLLFLVSPSSECVTGTYIKIDDGQNTR